jgi:multiple sugar transport system permease protein
MTSTVNSQAAVSWSKRKRRLAAWVNALLLIAPFTIVYLLFFIYPAAKVVQLSFTNADISGIGEFVGTANYQRLLADPLFWRSLKNTGYFVLLTVVPCTALALLFALMVVRLDRLKGFVMAAFFLPYILPVSVVTLIWQWLLEPRFGVVNQLFGLRLAWFQDPVWAMPAVALVTIWWVVGFSMLLFIAGLQSIPNEYREAAAIDGATGLQIFLNITWPLLWPITTLVLTLQLIAQLKIFAQVYILTGGGPFNSTIVVLQYMYRTAFQQFNAGYASTISMVLFVIIMVASLLQFYMLRSRGVR